MVRRTRRAVAAACLGVALAGGLASTVQAQTGSSSSDTSTTTTNPLDTLLPPSTTAPPATDSTTTTTGAPDSTTTTPSPPIGAGDEGLSPVGGDPSQVIPPEAAALYAKGRSAPNDDRANVADEKALLAAGYSPDDAARLAYGRFPIAGPSHWQDDFLAPRFSGTEFRYHLGVDLIADDGTPLRSPADGVVDLYDDDEGGLAVLVKDADGTVYELAHMRELAPVIARGVTVKVGDLLGAVGESGDATGPHCHFGVWLNGVTPTSPKPLVDQWVADAHAQVTALLHPVLDSRTRPLLGNALVTALADDGPSTPTVSPDLLYATAANPAGGSLRVAEATATAVGNSIDWDDR